jgi:hypothetical protein
MCQPGTSMVGKQRQNRTQLVRLRILLAEESHQAAQEWSNSLNSPRINRAWTVDFRKSSRPQFPEKPSHDQRPKSPNSKYIFRDIKSEQSPSLRFSEFNFLSYLSPMLYKMLGYTESECNINPPCTIQSQPLRLILTFFGMRDNLPAKILFYEHIC